MMNFHNFKLNAAFLALLCFLSFSPLTSQAVTFSPDLLVRGLERGLYGEDVLELQKFLNNSGFVLAEEGPGSPGNETTFFGDLTLEALKNFQEANPETYRSVGLEEPSGYFGAATREAVVEIAAVSPVMEIIPPDEQTLVRVVAYEPFVGHDVEPEEIILDFFREEAEMIRETATVPEAILVEAEEGAIGVVSGLPATPVSVSETPSPRTVSNLGHSSVVHTLTYAAGSNGAVTGSLTQMLGDGVSGTAVTAVPDTGYSFSGWSDGSTANPRTDSNVVSSLSVTAEFVMNASDLTNLALSGSPANFSFSGSTYTYDSVTVLNPVNEVTVTPTGSGIITVDGVTVTSGQASSAISLTAGVEKTITVVVAETGKTNKTYTINVTRNSGVATTPTFSPVAGAITFGTTVVVSSSGADAVYYTTDGSTPTTSSTNQATTPLVINSAVTVKALAVKATYDDSSIASAAYTQAATADLSGLALSNSPSNYTFAGGTYTYNSVTVASNVSSITVTPTGSGTITVDGVTVTSGQASSAISLTSGVEKTITVIATETGKSAKTYTINVTRIIAVPTSLAASAVSTSQINLSWTNTDASAQTRVYRDSSLVTTVSAGTSSYNDTGLSAGTNYVYTVRHYLNSIESANSSSANATTQYLVDVLMVGGGGGGGGGAWSSYGTGGGGGGGEFLEWTGQTVSSGGTAVTVSIGAGGAGGATNSGGPSASGSNGGNTSLSGGLSKSVAGGGGGGGHHLSGLSGGNGGGAGSSLGSPGSASPIGGGYGSGNGGAVGAGAWGYAGGGGGGAGGSGTGGLSSESNVGGPGRASSYSGSSQTYAGGGGGGVAASGGSGGGGTGGNIYSTGAAPTAGSYYGAGGGAGVTSIAGPTHYNGSSGYQGVVIIRYLGSQKGTGGSVSSSGGYTIHTFTSGGTFTP